MTTLQKAKLPADQLSRLVEKLRTELAERKSGNPGFVPLATDELEFISALVIKHHLALAGRRARLRAKSAEKIIRDRATKVGVPR